MELSALTAVSPIDGRYRGKTSPLSEYFSEYALIRYRIRVEIEYFIALCELPLPQLADFPHELFPRLRSIYQEFTPQDAQRVKDIEAVTNHDVKAVEYFIKERLDTLLPAAAVPADSQERPSVAPASVKNFVHFGLTSQDINNTSVPLSLKEALDQVYIPLLEELVEQLNDYASSGVTYPCSPVLTDSRPHPHALARR